MGQLFIQYLEPGAKVYACKVCGVHLAKQSDLLSKNFHSRSGTAFLFECAVNVVLGALEEREMTTGRHQVRDLSCVGCGQQLGWRYEYAHERREKYKEGKVILERVKFVGVEESTSASATSPHSSIGAAFDTMSLLSDVDGEDACYL